MLTELLREGVKQVLLLSCIPLLASAIVSLGVSIVQAATQVQEQTSAFIIRVVAYAIALLLVAPSLSRGLVRFIVLCFQTASSVAR